MRSRDLSPNERLKLHEEASKIEDSQEGKVLYIGGKREATNFLECIGSSIPRKSTEALEVS